MSFSVVPYLFGRDWWNTFDYPSQIFDQFFGSALSDSDLLPPMLLGGYVLRPRTQACIATSGQSEVINDDKKFQVKLQVSQFEPKEVEVKTVGNYVVIHGKHEEKSDEHGFVSREFTRKYMLPQGVKAEDVKSSLNKDGMLTIEAPKQAIEAPPQKERTVPISKL